MAKGREMAVGKITSRGQITIPAQFRKKLGTDVVSIEMEGNKIVIKPLSIGGMLKEYAFKDKKAEEIVEIEKRVGEEAFKGEWK
jgi:AbrB family looped-hinge helix DNA binding protein